MDNYMEIGETNFGISIWWNTVELKFVFYKVSKPHGKKIIENKL